MSSRFVAAFAFRAGSGPSNRASLRAFHRGQRGLYGGKRIVFGNNVSHSERKTRRHWKPNAQYVTLWSEFLQQKIPTRATTYALRWMDKRGGLDNYLINTSNQKLASAEAIRLKQMVIGARAQKQRNAALAAQKGISVEELERSQAGEQQERIDKFKPPGVIWLGQEETINHMALHSSEGTTDDSKDASSSTWHSLWSDAEDLEDDESQQQWKHWVTKTGKTMLLTREQYNRRVATMQAMKKSRITRIGV